MMQLLGRIGLGAFVAIVLLSAGEPVAAQQSTDSKLTNSIQLDRMIVLQVDPAAGRVYCLEAGGRLRVVESTTTGVPLIVINNGGRRADLSLLIAGDLIKVQRAADGRAPMIVVLRRASDEIGSPEQ